MVWQLTKRLGNPRHLQPCSATYRMAFNSVRFERLTLPRCRGRTGAMRSYCPSLISISTQYQKIVK
jgi:hypothetical protein